MNPRWEGEGWPVYPRITPLGWVRVVVRACLLVLLVFGGLLILLAVRLIERPSCGLNRPATPYITQFVCRTAFRILGIKHTVKGTPMEERGAVVANHSSWLDIFSLNAAKRIYFVSKSDVARWPGIGWLARATGTVFLERDRARAREQTQVFQDRLLAGHKLLFFPEGTSTDGLRVLPFKTTLFEAFFAKEIRAEMAVQPVSVRYTAPKDCDRRFYGWWGDMSFGGHLLEILAPAQQGSVTLHYHTPLRVADFTDRKALALACEEAVRAGHDVLRNT